MKKLLIATDSFLPRWDGISRFLYEVIPYLKEYNITILCPHFKGELKGFENVKIIRYPLLGITIDNYGIPKPKIKSIKKYIKESDVIMVQTIGPIGYYSMKYARKYKKSLINYIHSIEWELVSKSLNVPKIIQKLIEKLIKIITRKLYNKSNLLLVPSKHIGVILSDNKIHTLTAIIPLGVNTNKFIMPKTKEIAKELINIDPSYRVVGYVGRISREKDVLTLYRAFLQLNEPKLKLLLVGSIIPQYLKKLSNKKNVILTGQQNNTVKYYQAMDVYVLPSLTETTSLSTLEAMSCGVPVISTNVGLISTYIENNSNGFLFPVGNSFVLKKKIEWLLKDPVKRREVGMLARNSIKEKFSWENTAESIKLILEDY